MPVLAGAGRELVVTYKDGRDALRVILERATELGFDAALTGTRREEMGRGAVIEVSLRFNHGNTSTDKLVAALTEIRGVKRVEAAMSSDSSL